jgi:DNA-binding HxlR family transcriptional regulator
MVQARHDYGTVPPKVDYRLTDLGLIWEHLTLDHCGGALLRTAEAREYQASHAKEIPAVGANTP